MKQHDTQTKKQIKTLQAQLKTLQEALREANKKEGNDPYIAVKLYKKRAHSQRIRKRGEADRASGKFFMEIGITAKQQPVFMPLSIASGKKVAGFMYQIEGTAAGTLMDSDISVRGDGVSQVTVGTLLFVKIPTSATATYRIVVTVGGNFGKTYKIVFPRVNYKLELTEHRYQQYVKEIQSPTVKFS